MADHKLILSSNSPIAEPVVGDSIIAWHHDAGSNKHDKIKQWQPVRGVVSDKDHCRCWLNVDIVIIWRVPA